MEFRLAEAAKKQFNEHEGDQSKMDPALLEMLGAIMEANRG